MPTDMFFRSVQLDRVRLRVADLDRARAFYEHGLGLHAQTTGHSEITFSPAADEPALLELEAAPSARARPPGAAGLFHVAFLFPTRESLGRMLAHLARSGVRLSSAQ